MTAFTGAPKSNIRTDAFFDGTLGRKLVKIIPVEQPLTLLDLGGNKGTSSHRRSSNGSSSKRVCSPHKSTTGGRW